MYQYPGCLLQFEFPGKNKNIFTKFTLHLSQQNQVSCFSAQCAQTNNKVKVLVAVYKKKPHSCQIDNLLFKLIKVDILYLNMKTMYDSLHWIEQNLHSNEREDVGLEVDVLNQRILVVLSIVSVVGVTELMPMPLLEPEYSCCYAL